MTDTPQKVVLLLGPSKTVLTIMTMTAFGVVVSEDLRMGIDMPPGSPTERIEAAKAAAIPILTAEGWTMLGGWEPCSVYASIVRTDPN